MPENKLENFVFTVIMAFLMVYAMICYNIALNIGVRGKLILQLHGKQFLRCTVRTSFIAW